MLTYFVLLATNIVKFLK